MVDRSTYCDRFLDAVDAVESGRKGSIAGNKWLINNYCHDFYRSVAIYLRSSDSRVVSEIIDFFTAVEERTPLSEIKVLRKEGSESVRLSSLGYLKHMDDNDRLIEELFDTLEHKDGQEFLLAARKMAKIARTSDVAHIRSIYGQVGGTMREQIKTVMESIISRSPELEDKRDLLLSVPVYPNEYEFESFLDKSIDYLDVRYRTNILPKDSVSLKTYNNIAIAMKTMRTRLYNESDNLAYYGPDKTDRFFELEKLMEWAASDLSGKNIIMPDRRTSRPCPRCGTSMSFINGMWSCPDCGIQ